MNFIKKNLKEINCLAKPSYGMGFAMDSMLNIYSRYGVKIFVLPERPELIPLDINNKRDLKEIND